jgi:uroporphyrinogen decarboxylase
MNSIFLDTLNKKDTNRPPVWFMRQAGRILPSYQALKQVHSFSDLMKNPELAAQVTLLPINDLGVDAAILFSDILIVPEALGMGLEFTDKGPIFSKPLTQYKNPSEQLIIDRSKLTHVYDNIDEVIKTRPENIPLIGFCGGPLTTFCFMFRGHARDVTFHDAIKFLYSNPKESKKIIDALTELSIEYALKQVEHGVECFQLFETYAGLIPEELYKELIFSSSKRILNAVRDKGVPTIYLPKNFGGGLKYINKDICDFISIDWHTPIKTARSLVDNSVGLQGNIDPRLLYADESVIVKKLEEMIPFGRDNQDWIFNLGHGFLPDIKMEKAKFVVDWVKETNWNR